MLVPWVTRHAATTARFSISGFPSSSPNSRSPVVTVAMPASCAVSLVSGSSSSTIGASNRSMPAPAVTLRDHRGTLWASLDHSHQPDPRRQMARLYRRPDLCRRHPRPPRSQRPLHRSRRREPQTPTLHIDPKELTTSSQLCQKNLPPAGRPPARRHHLVSPGDIIAESAGDFVGIYKQAASGPKAAVTRLPSARGWPVWSTKARSTGKILYVTSRAGRESTTMSGAETLAI